MTISECLRQIRAYQEIHPELKRAHHFLFDRRLQRMAAQPKILVIGLNPGEDPSDWTLNDGPTEESSEYDFHEIHGNGARALRWSARIEEYCGTTNVSQSEFFFWSSKSIRRGDFDSRFDYSFRDNPHFEFCRDMNLALVRNLEPELVVCPGLGGASFAPNLYGLAPNHILRDDTTSHRLVEHFSRGGVPWLFTKHWSGARGLTVEQKVQIKNYIRNYVPTS